MKLTLEVENETLTQLLKATFFGFWLKNATRSEEEQDPAMESFVQYVLGTAWTAGEKTRITVDSDGHYEFSLAFTEVLLEQVDLYDAEIFWDELVEQLARRDYFQKNPAKIGKDLTGKAADEADAGIEREKDKYDKEFEERGVERLRIVR
jgi:hypothetical protein